MAKLISLQGATVTVPANWTAIRDYGVFSINFKDLNADTGLINEYNSFNIGYGSGFDLPIVRDNSVCFVYNNEDVVEYMLPILNVDSFNIEIVSGDDVTNQSLIQWFVDNNATIEGGVYEQDEQLDIFLTEIGDAIREVKGTTELINARDMASIVREMNGSQVKINYSSETSDPIPLNEIVENIYFNISMSVEDVNAYIGTEDMSETIFYNYDEEDGSEFGLYIDYILNLNMGFITKYIYHGNTDEEINEIVYISRSVADDEEWLYGGEKPEFIGWNPNLTNPIEINLLNMAETHLRDWNRIMGISPFGQEITKTLNGEYDGSNLIVTENQNVSINDMIDDHRIPLNIKVNVPIPDGYVKPEGQYRIHENGTYDITEYEEAYVNIYPPASTLNIVENGTYNVQDYGYADVNVPKGVPIEIDSLDSALLVEENEGKVYKYNGKLYRIVGDEEGKTLTTLTGSTVTVPANWTATAGYGHFSVDILIPADPTDPTDFDSYYDLFYIGYRGGSSGIGGLTATENCLYFYSSVEGASPKFRSVTYNGREESFIVQGGTDANNPLLIQWFINNNTTIEGGTYEYSSFIFQEILSPTGELAITENGTYDVTNYASANVNISSSSTSSGAPIEVATEEEMNALLVANNVGKVYKYTGETTDTYVNGELYQVVAE